MSIDEVGDLVYRKYLARLKKLRDRSTMTLDERRELLINTIIRERMKCHQTNTTPENRE